MREDANKIIQIASEYLDEEQMNEFFAKLKQINAVQEVFAEAWDILNPPQQPVSIFFWFAFWGLVVVHFALVVGEALSFILLPFLAPWYIALPLMTFVFFFATTRVECQLTNLENRMRKRAGMKRIGGFIGFYMLRPLRAIKSKLLEYYYERKKEEPQRL